MAETPHTFTGGGARRIVDVVRRVENTPQDLRRGEAPPLEGRPPGLVFFRITEVSAMSDGRHIWPATGVMQKVTLISFSDLDEVEHTIHPTDGLQQVPQVGDVVACAPLARNWYALPGPRKPLVVYGYCKVPATHPAAGLPLDVIEPQALDADSPRSIMVYRCDQDGTPFPLTDPEDPEVEPTLDYLRVWKNAARAPMHLPYVPDETVFVYLRYAPESWGGEGYDTDDDLDLPVDGVLLNRIDQFASHASAIPAGGWSPGSPYAAPDSTDVTGDPTDPEHVHVRGDMYLRPSGNDRRWAPWFTLDPAALSEAMDSHKVKADATDEEPDFLDAKLTGDGKWITTDAVTQAGVRKVEISHAGPDEEDSSIDAINSVAVLDVAGVSTLRIISQKLGHDAVGHLTGASIEGENDGLVEHDVPLGLLDRNVAVNAADDEPGSLDDKLTVDGAWLQKSVVSGALHLEHIGPAEQDSLYHPLGTLEVNGNSLVLTSHLAGVDAKGHIEHPSVNLEAVNLPLTAVTVVTDIRIDETTMQLQKKTRTIYVLKAGAESGWTEVHTGEDCEGA